MEQTQTPIDQELAQKTQLAIQQGLLLLKTMTRTRLSFKALQPVLQNEISYHLSRFPHLKFKSVGDPMKGHHGTVTYPLYFTYKTPADEKPAGND